MGKWVKKKLGEYVVLQGGFAFQSKDFVEDGVPLIRIGDITKEGLCDENAVKLPVYFLDECKEFVLNEYDTIIAMSGATTGKCTIVSKKNLPALLNQRVGRFKIKNSSIDKLYLYYIVSSYYYQQKLLLDAIGGAQPNVSPRQIEKVICAFPILPDGSPDFSEQRRIASILSSADKVIDSTQKLIAKYKQIKQGMMEDLLKPKEGWKLVKLGECLTIGNGQDYKHLNNGDVPVYGTGGIITYVNSSLYEGDTVCIGRKGTINKPIFYSGKLWTVDTLFYTHSFVDVLPLFLFYIFCNIDWNKYNEATGVPSLSKETIYKIEISISDLSEQRRIASILSGIDKKIESEEKVLEKYKKIKKGLMERLLMRE
jgi:type I restriction enzyme S subunit